MNYIEGMDRTQIRYECLNDYIDDDSEVQVIDKLIDSMDLESLGFNMGNNEENGRARYYCGDMVKLLTYGYSNGPRSSRKLKRQTEINREVIWLIKGLKPKYRVIADFRKENIEPLKKVFEVFTEFCIELGLCSKELIAVDGTKIKANASRKKHYSKSKIKVMKEKAREQIDRYLKDLEENDMLEDSDEKEEKKVKIQQAIKKIEERQEKYKKIEKILKDKGVSEINLTDPDVATMNANNFGKDLAYNVQAAVDSKNNIIVACDVINNPTDLGELYDMSKKAKDILGLKEEETLETLADKGYFNTDELAKCEKDHIIPYVPRQKENNSTGNQDYVLSKFTYDEKENVYICPEGQKLYCHTEKMDAKEKIYYNTEACSHCKNRDKCTTSKEKGRKLRIQGNHEFGKASLMRVKDNYEKYRKRQTIAEPVFGTVKRALNFGYFLLRRIGNTLGEACLAFFAYNLKRVINIKGIKGLIEEIEHKKVIRYGA